MKKIGILTEYHKSKNYGGVLQAYALCRVLNYNCSGIHAEQIPCRRGQGYRYQLMNAKGIKETLIIIYEICQKIAFNIMHMPRIISFARFRKHSIPHNPNKYNDETLYRCLNRYEAFVVGSDQVWNPKYGPKGYLLSFVPQHKTKISYAASMAVDSLTKEQERVFKETLESFHAISVREEKAVELLQPLTDKPVELLVDPVLLLTREEWDEVASNRTIKGNYIFAYYLGYYEKSRKITMDFAKAHGCKVVFIPYVKCWYNEHDGTFGDIRLSNVSPQDFIALIKNAQYVFTDSFHATVFSNIYEKEYFIFNRDEKANMSSRIFGITNLFHTEDRFCYSDERMTLDYLHSVDKIDYSVPNQKLIEMKKKSMNFLTESLSKEI